MAKVRLYLIGEFMAGKLGNMKKVNVRVQWPHEAADFTPWLAQEENILLLSHAIGIELAVENTEVAVGPYAADILAKDTGTGDYVVIENQLEKTDHDHLGKSITYAAVLNASAIVWIASNFTEEHKKALDWLNDNSSESISFFGVGLELWQIDDSNPAVNFNVISAPAEYARKSTITKASVPLTDTQRLQLEWWNAFRSKLLEDGIVQSAQRAHPQVWYDVAIGRSGFVLNNTASPGQKRIAVKLYMSPNSESAMDQLLEQKAEIEKEIGEVLEWNPNPESRGKVVALYRDADIANRDAWEEALGWMVDYTSRFRNAFSRRVRQLQLDENAEAANDS